VRRGKPIRLPRSTPPGALSRQIGSPVRLHDPAPAARGRGKRAGSALSRCRLEFGYEAHSDLAFFA